MVQEREGGDGGREREVKQSADFTGKHKRNTHIHTHTHPHATMQGLVELVVEK